MSINEHETSFGEWVDSQRSSGKAETPLTDVNAVGAQGQDTLILCRFCGKPPFRSPIIWKPEIVRCINSRCPIYGVTFTGVDWSKPAPSVGAGVSDHAAGAVTSNLNYWHKEYQARLRYMASALDEAEIWVLHVTAINDGETYTKAASTLQKIRSALQYKPSSPTPVAPVGHPEAEEEEIAREAAADVCRFIPNLRKIEFDACNAIILAAIRKAKSAPVGQVHEGQPWTRKGSLRTVFEGDKGLFVADNQEEADKAITAHNSTISGEKEAT